MTLSLIYVPPHLLCRHLFFLFLSVYDIHHAQLCINSVRTAASLADVGGQITDEMSVEMN